MAVSELLSEATWVAVNELTVTRSVAYFSIIPLQQPSHAQAAGSCHPLEASAPPDTSMQGLVALAGGANRLPDRLTNCAFDISGDSSGTPSLAFGRKPEKLPKSYR